MASDYSLYLKKVSDNVSFDAYIDPEDQFQMNDKFSQLNKLVQLENLKNFDFLRDKLAKKKIMAYAMWLDIYTGDVYFFRLLTISSILKYVVKENNNISRKKYKLKDLLISSFNETKLVYSLVVLSLLLF